MTTAADIILVDDEAEIRLAYTQALEIAGLRVRSFERAEQALELIAPAFAGIVLSDIRLPGLDGMSLLGRVRASDAELPVVLITGHADLPLAVRAMREGAYDFLEKPAGAQLLVATAQRALAYRRLVLENRRLRQAPGGVDPAEARLPGRAGGIEAARAQLVAAARTDMDVLIVGETGTGKGVAARLLHDLSARADRPFIVIDCAALSEDRIETELFGHEAGAFPGALRARFGRLEHGRGGTVLLDDIDSLTLAMQAKLLHVIEDRAVTRLGGQEAIPLDLRFVATSKAELEAEAAAGRFRADLLYRLNSVTIHLPRLHDRRDDIAGLFLHLAQEAADRHGREVPPLAPAALADLAQRDWPGNIRELRNLAECHVLGLPVQGLDPEMPRRGRLSEQVDSFERRVIAGALGAAGGSLRTTYEILGVSRKTLYEKMQKHGLSRQDFLAAPGAADRLEDD